MKAMIRSVAGWIRNHPTLAKSVLRCMPDYRRTVRVPSIGPFEIRARTDRSYWLRSPINDRWFFGGLRSLIRPDDVVYDIGAHIGIYTRFFATVCRASRVFSFEPATANRALLQRNVELGDITDRTTVLPFAVADKDGEEDFQLDQAHSQSGALYRIRKGASSFAELRYGMRSTTQVVPVCRLDTLLNKGLILPPNVMKIDIEGAEGLALRGAPEMLRRYSPRLGIELHGPSCVRDVVGILLDAGYHMFARIPDASGRRYSQVTPGLCESLQGDYDVQYLYASKVLSDVASQSTEYVG
jgi:FkbM family methyltransferase